MIASLLSRLQVTSGPMPQPFVRFPQTVTPPEFNRPEVSPSVCPFVCPTVGSFVTLLSLFLLVSCLLGSERTEFPVGQAVQISRCTVRPRRSPAGSRFSLTLMCSTLRLHAQETDHKQSHLDPASTIGVARIFSGGALFSSEKPKPLLSVIALKTQRKTTLKLTNKPPRPSASSPDTRPAKMS